MKEFCAHFMRMDLFRSGSIRGHTKPDAVLDRTGHRRKTTNGRVSLSTDLHDDTLSTPAGRSVAGFRRAARQFLQWSQGLNGGNTGPPQGSASNWHFESEKSETCRTARRSKAEWRQHGPQVGGLGPSTQTQPSRYVHRGLPDTAERVPAGTRTF
jgi:hypothetical protein